MGKRKGMSAEWMRHIRSLRGKGSKMKSKIKKHYNNNKSISVLNKKLNYRIKG